MVKNIIQQKEWVSQPSLRNSKMFYLMKKLLDKKWKKFKVKSINYELTKLTKSLSCFDDKRYVLDDGIRTLAYFHKNSVTSRKEIEKDCDKKGSDKRDCDNRKPLW